MSKKYLLNKYIFTINDFIKYIGEVKHYLYHVVVVLCSSMFRILLLKSTSTKC